MSEIPFFPIEQVTSASAALLSELSGRDITRSRAEPSREAALRNIALLALDAGYLSEATEFFASDLDSLLAFGEPYVFAPWRSGKAYVILSVHRGRAMVLGPGGERVKLSAAAFRALLGSAAEGRARERAERLARGVPGLRVSRVLSDALKAETASEFPLGVGFVFRKNTARSTGELAAQLKPGVYAGRLLGLSTTQSALTTASWALIGALALTGHADSGSLLAWALLSVTAALLQIFTTRMVGQFTLRAATGLRQRLLEGALRIVPENLSAFGLGGLMVLAAQADSFLSSVILLFVFGLTTFTNVLAAVLLLGSAPLASFGVGIFVVAVVLVAAFTPRQLRLSVKMQDERLRLTTELVERMLGHRTRLVQQTPNSWHEGEDESLSGYAAISRETDGVAVFLRAIPRSYFFCSLVVVFFVIVAHPSPESLALSLGGLTMGMAALEGVVNFQATAAGLHALFVSIRPLLQETDEAPSATAAASGPVEEAGAVEERHAVVELRGVQYGYEGRSRPVLDDVSFTIRAGDRVLIEGPSGGGKTTLASLVSVIRKPDAGLVLVNGVDHHTMQERELRSVIASAPQFYKNHIFSAPLAFNLLIGRKWPPSPEDLADATEVMHALGLSDLVARMPGGLYQQVGETGWQLSHGERSRVFLARTLLQPSEVVVLDETFGALDPASLRECMAAVKARVRTLVVITHR